jgi:hypothetical protein
MDWTRQNFEVSLATMLHLWLLVIQSQRSKLYGAIFSIMFFLRHSDPGLFPKDPGL